eukprot:IDg13128t1
MNYSYASQFALPWTSNLAFGAIARTLQTYELRNPLRSRDAQGACIASPKETRLEALSGREAHSLPADSLLLWRASTLQENPSANNFKPVCDSASAASLCVDLHEAGLS